MTPSNASRLLILIGLSVLFSACATKGDDFYKRAPSVHSLEVPPDLTKPTEDDTYEIPQIGDIWKREALLKDGSKVRVERDGDLRWLVLTGKPDVFWDRIHQFWEKGKTKLAWENRGLGIMETEWVHNKDSRFARDKFRVRLEPGKEPNTTYLFLTHQGVQAEFNGSEMVYTWTSRPNDPELEIEVLGDLLEYLGLEPEPKKDVIAKLKKEGQRAKLVADSAVPYIEIAGSKDKVWMRLQRAIDRLGNIVEDSDKDKGILKVRLDTESNSDMPSFLGGERDKFTIKLSEQGKAFHISILTEDGEDDSSQAAVDYLTKLQKNL